MRERVASGRGHVQAPIGFRASGISWIRPNFTASGAPDKDPSSDTENGNTEQRSGHSDRRRLTLGTLGTITRKATPITEFQSAARDTLRTAREKAEPYRWLIFPPTPPGLPPHQAGFIFALRSSRSEPQERNPRSSLPAARYRRPKRTPLSGPDFLPSTASLWWVRCHCQWSLSRWAPPTPQLIPATVSLLADRRLPHSRRAGCHVSARKRQNSAA